MLRNINQNTPYTTCCMLQTVERTLRRPALRRCLTSEFEPTYANSNSRQALVRALTSSLARIIASPLSGMARPRVRGR
jgi:hypothetical protein